MWIQMAAIQVADCVLWIVLFFCFSYNLLFTKRRSDHVEQKRSGTLSWINILWWSLFIGESIPGSWLRFAGDSAAYVRYLRFMLVFT